MDQVLIEIDEKDPSRIAVQSSYRDKDQIARVPGANWDAKARVWKTRLSWPACIQLRAEFGERLQIGPRLKEWAVPVSQKMGELLQLRDAEDADDLQHLTRLSPLQRAAVKVMVVAEQAAETDPMGGGKTVITINALEELGDDAYPALIVCTKIMRQTWLEHFREWAPDRNAVLLEGPAPKRRKILDERPDVLIVNWALLVKHSKLAPYGPIRLSDAEKEPKELNGYGLKTVVADAAQNAVNPPTKQTRALWAIGHDPSVKYRFPLTGSIGDEAAEDIWSLLHFIAPEEWPTKTKYVDRYCELGYSFFGFHEIKGFKAEKREELFSIAYPRMIRRPMELLLPQVPARDKPQIRTMEMTPKQKKAYKEVKESMLALLDNGTLIASNPLTKATRLWQFASSYGEIDPGTGNFFLREPSNKVDAALDILDEAGNEPVVFFAPSRQLIELLADRLQRLDIRHGLVTGEVGDADRNEAIARFQNNELRALLLTTGAGGEGLTLTASSICCFLQRSGSFLENTEAEGRLHRWGQKNPVRVIDIVSEGTLEPDILESLKDKNTQFQQLVQDEATLRRWLSR